jgi:hypothetical protein
MPTSCSIDCVFSVGFSQYDELSLSTKDRARLGQKIQCHF